MGLLIWSLRYLILYIPENLPTGLKVSNFHVDNKRLLIKSLSICKKCSYFNGQK